MATKAIIARSLIGSMFLLMGNISLCYAAISPNVSTTQIRDFTRVTFNWPEQVRFKVEESSNGITLTFEKAANIDLSSLRSQLQGRLRASEVSPDGRQISLSFDQPYRVRHFISGNANGIDILNTSAPIAATAPQIVTQAPAAAPPPAVTPPSAPVAAPATPPAVAAPLPEAKPAAPQQVAPTAPAVQPPVPAAPPPAPPAAPVTQPVAVPNAPPAAPIPAETATVSAAAPAAEPIAQPISPAQPEAAPTTPVEPAPVTPPAPPVAEITVEPPVVIPPAGTAAATTEPAAPTIDLISSVRPDTSKPLIITAKGHSTGTDLHFGWTHRVASTVFMRGKTLWIAFSDKQPINQTLFSSILPAAVKSLSVVEHPTYTLLRLETDGSIHPKTQRADNSTEWVITLSNYAQVPNKPSPLALMPTARTPHIYVPVLEYAEPATITDPLLGDQLIITPFYNAGEAAYPPRDFVDFELLNSAQGMGIVKKSDFARVAPLRNGLRITSKSGLHLSKDLPAIADSELEAMRVSATTLFPYDQWKIEPGTFASIRQEIERQLVGAAPIRANSLRLKLAQLYLGQGMAQEARALLDLIANDDRGFYIDRQLAALRGATNFLTADYPAATADFASKELEDVEEIKLWRQAMDVFQTDRARFDYLEFYKSFIQKYPPRLKNKLAILAADNYINRKSYQRALKTFDTMAEAGNKVDPELMPYVDFLLGKIAAESGNVDKARAIWLPLTTHDDRFIRARADFSLTALLYNDGSMPIDEAIKRLDQLRIVWRGDTLELGLLSFLGQLYTDQGNYLEGLRAWRELVTNFPESSVALTTARDMATTFNKLFTDGVADELTPLQALSIFYEFRELTPVGTAGDSMIQNLADRLASVDLLDRAAALLEHQIEFRQEGETRSSLGAQLALIYLLNEQPEKALAVLQLTGYGNNSEELYRKRQQLTALGLSETGKHERAISMLSGDDSEDATMLRLNIFWKMRDWRNVIRSAEDLLASRADITAPLTITESEYLLQLAIAYVFERDRPQLYYLRNYFDPLMQDNPNRDIFLYITDDTGPVDPKAFEEVTTQINRIESFMQSYRDKISSGGLSSALN